MSREEFIDELKECLVGKVSADVIEETVRYYNDYISDAVNNGASEEEVIDTLGRGSFIAKTIIEANNSNKDGTANIQYGKFTLNSWYGKVFIILAAILVIGIVLAIIASLFTIIFNIILPIAILLFIIWIIVYIVKRVIK